MSNILVTGGAGFIGSSLVRFLLEKGQTVRVLDNFETGKRENLAEIVDHIDLVEADIRDTDALTGAVKDIEIVYHLAALGSVPLSIEDPATTHAVNVDGIFNLLTACRQCKVRRFVFASSSAVYGDSEVMPQHEDLPMQPISPYGASKAIGELYCRVFYETYGLETLSLRYFNVFGPHQNPNSHYAAAIPLFVSALMKDKPPTIFDDGEQSRGFTYIDNVTQANWLCGQTDQAKGQVLNISTPDAVTVNTVVNTIKNLLGKEHIEPVYTDPRPGDIKHSLADVSRAAQTIGYKTDVSFKQGIQKAIDWYKANL